MARPVSILDLARVAPHETVAESFAASVEIARHAETLGFYRVWYAEHHNMRSIASSATSVLIAHVAQTSTIRLGAGGIMLPNHSPLQIAEQFGTLETLHPGRIDLGLGRAPGTDQVTLRALRHDPGDAEHFPQDVLELQPSWAIRAVFPASPRHPATGPRYRCTSSGPRCSARSWPRCWGCPTVSPRTSHLPRCRTLSPCTGGSSSRPSSSMRPMCWPVST